MACTHPHGIDAAGGPAGGSALDELGHQIHADAHDARHQEPGEGERHLEARRGHQHEIADTLVRPLRSATITGTTMKLATVHAMPSRPATIRPTHFDRSSIIRRIKPTVAESSAQPAICGRRAAASRKPSPTVG